MERAFSWWNTGAEPYLKVLKDTGIQLEDIHDIFITHEHIDHLLGVIWLIRMIGRRRSARENMRGICGSTA